MADDFEFDFLPPGLGYADLADPKQTLLEADQGVRDPWFDVAHPELFADWRRASRGRMASLGGRGRRLSGMARRCSNQGSYSYTTAAADAAAAAVRRRGSSTDGAGKENLQQQQQQQPPAAGLMAPPPPKEPSRKQSLGTKRPRALMSGAAAVPVHQQQEDEEEDEEEGAYYMEEDDGMDVDYGDHRGRGSAGRGGGAVNDHAMRQRLEEFRMAKQAGKVGAGGGRHLQQHAHTKATASHHPHAAASAASGGAAPSHLGRKPAVPRQAKHGTHATKSSSAPTTTPRLAASSASMAKGGAAAASTGGGVHGRNIGVAGAVGKRGPTAAAASAAAVAADEEMKALVARHNKKFKPAAPAYVPTLSIRDTRKWEEMTGRSYRALNYAEREQANNEIKAMKLAEAQDAGTAGAGGGGGSRRGR